MSYILLGGTALILALTLLLVRSWTERVVQPAEAAVSGTVPVERALEAEPAAHVSAKGATETRPEKLLNVAIVIDDVGNSLEELKPFLKLPLPVTFAVMPLRTYTAESVERIKAAGKSYIMHQPMEAEGGANPGEGAIYSGMERDEVYRILEENIASLGGVSGMNNHMGSRVTADAETMGYILDFLNEKGMFFLDSLTTGESVAGNLAKERDLPYLERNSMFLDNNRERDYIERALRSGFEIAGQSGRAVMIGHVWDQHLAELLLELYPEFTEAGYSFDDIGNMIYLGRQEEE
jgi:uncharacterized protein